MKRAPVAKLRWSHYKRNIPNAKHAARFLVGTTIVLTGFAPYPKFNRLICRLFNEHANSVKAKP